MKLKLTTSALVLALTGTAAFAQGLEGHQIGYTDKEPATVSFSTKGNGERVVVETRRVYGDRTQTPAIIKEREVTVYRSLEDNLEDTRVPR